MKKYLVSKTVVFVLSLLLAVSTIFFVVFGVVVPDVFAQDVVGKKIMPYQVRFEVKAGNKTFSYDLMKSAEGLSESQKEDRLIFCSVRKKREWVRKIEQQGFDPLVAWCYVLPDLNRIVKECERIFFAEPVDAAMKFCPNDKSRFVYVAEKVGSRLDRADFLRSLERAAVSGGAVVAKAQSVPPDVTEAMLRNATCLKAKFVTSCISSTLVRKANVKRALAAFHGKVVSPAETVSFNAEVGPRTKENGFGDAKIIVDGKYVPGVGGGVCQASTTLYNALLLAGVSVNKVHQHSLVSSYVQPSFDAMVSSVSDLVFTNNTDGKLYFVAYCTDKDAVVEIFGLPNEFEIRRRSVEVERKPFPVKVVEDVEGKYADKVFFENETFVLAKGVDGLTSEGWLDYFKDGKQVDSRRIRRNTYLPTEQVVVKGVAKLPSVVGGSGILGEE